MILQKPTEGEIHLAADVGILRHIFALRYGLEHAHGRDEIGGWEDHINGAIGEQCLAKHLKVYWSGTIGTTKASCDVGAGYQARATDHPRGRLIVHHSDNDNQPFVLARILLPEVHLIGWLWGSEAKHPDFWWKDAPRPAFFAWPVHDMATLPDAETVRARLARAA